MYLGIRLRDEIISKGNYKIQSGFNQGITGTMESISSFSMGYQSQPIATVLEQLEQPLPYQPDYLDSEPNDQILAECQQWLNKHQDWGRLPAEILQAIAHSLLYFQVDPQTLIYQEGQTPIGLYFLKSGTIEIFRRSVIGRSLIRYRNAGDLFGHLLIANTTSGTYQSNAIALTSSEIYFLPKDSYERLICLYPLIQQVMNGLISGDLQEYASRIAWEEERMRSLQSYIQHIPSYRQILGNSKAAQKLELQINQAAANPQPVILQAEAGTGKTFIAGLVYAYLPLTLAANLAHYIPTAITEAGRILPIFAGAIGWNGVNLPSLIWSLDVAQFLQGVTLFSVLAFSPYPLLRITKRSWLSNLPHLFLMGGLTTLFFKLMI